MRHISSFGYALAYLILVSSPARAQTAPEAPPIESEGETPAGETAPPAATQEAAPETPEPPPEEPSPEELVPEVFNAKIYGYIDAHFEQVAQTPVGVDSMGRTIMESNPSEIDVNNFNVMVQGTIFQKFRYFINLAAPGAGSPVEDASLDVRNAWVELPLFRQYFNLRIGKTYRRFGLYNEILDAVPTFIGIEPPELFDKDHLLLTRTTNIMLHGTFTTVDSAFSYALSTGNDEREGAQVPIGADLRYDYGTALRLGTSYYTTSGKAVASRSVGDGSPLGGVATWMAEDEYSVVGGYGQVSVSGFLLQSEYWQARHDAVRDADQVVKLAPFLEDGSPNMDGPSPPLNPRQLQRFGLTGPMPTPGDVITNIRYKINTAYVRTGYQFPVGTWTLTPYAQFDYYSNPEIIDDKDFGGDNEAGLTDNGKFYKSTLGVVIRPVSFVAVKVDGSTHTQKFNGESITYPEIRTSFSFYWEFGGTR